MISDHESTSNRDGLCIIRVYSRCPRLLIALYMLRGAIRRLPTKTSRLPAVDRCSRYNLIHFQSTKSAHTDTSSTMSLPTAQLPESVKALKLESTPKLHLYTAATPNGYKVSILLEELILAYPELAKGPLSYDFSFLSFDKKDQKQPEFLKVSFER